MNITIHPIRFRHSTAKYSCDETGIYKGIESVKFLNDKIADELYELREYQFDSFIDLLAKLKTLSVNSRQLDILIKLDFFNEFGEVNKLLKQVEYFDKIYGKKQFKKAKLAELNIPLNIAEKYATKVTEKTLTGMDTNGLLNEIVNTTEYPPTTLMNHFKYEQECLGYVITIDPSINKRLYYVSAINSTKYLTTITLYEIFSGKTRQVKMWTSQYSKSRFEVGTILYIISLEKKNKKEPTGEINPETGKKIYADVPDKFEYWLEKFIVKESLEDDR